MVEFRKKLLTKHMKKAICVFIIVVFAKNTSLEIKFPSPFGKFFVSRLVFFANTSPKQDISVLNLRKESR
jgi:hypothetical protein